MPMVLPCREAWCPNYQPCPDHPIRPFGGGEPMPPGWALVSARTIARAGGRCQCKDPACRFHEPGICGHPGTTADHIVPRWAGGTDADENMQALCKSCHAAKSGRS